MVRGRSIISGQERGMSTPIVVLEESAELATLFAGLLNHGGFKASAATGVAEVRRVMAEAAPHPVLLLVSSAVAAHLGLSFGELLKRDPRPLVALTCAWPGTCPLYPSQYCANMGCLKKPEDFVFPSLVFRVNRILERSTPPGDAARLLHRPSAAPLRREPLHDHNRREGLAGTIRV